MSKIIFGMVGEYIMIFKNSDDAIKYITWKKGLVRQANAKKCIVSKSTHSRNTEGKCVLCGDNPISCNTCGKKKKNDKYKDCWWCFKCKTKNASTGSKPINPNRFYHSFHGTWK